MTITWFKNVNVTITWFKNVTITWLMIKTIIIVEPLCHDKHVNHDLSTIPNKKRNANERYSHYLSLLQKLLKMS